MMTTTTTVTTTMTMTTTGEKVSDRIKCTRRKMFMPKDVRNSFEIEHEMETDKTILGLRTVRRVEGHLRPLNTVAE